MEKLIKEVPQCKHHKKKKLNPNEYWSPNPFEMYKHSVDSDSKEKKVKTTPTKFQENQNMKIEMLNECRSPINTKSDCSRQKGDFENRIGLIYSFGSDEALYNIWKLDE